ncbi:MAG TPA: transposase, partial [Mycobacterium sp.]|nr:transposase [Mycobacterium sp.]
RRLFLTRLEAAFDTGQLRFFGALASLEKPDMFTACLRPLRTIPWVVYAKRPFGGPEQVLDYLARYTHRVAIANSRLVALADGRVSFLWKDYRHHDRPKVMTLDAGEFIRRFLLHVLPDGFHRIRHYGYLANGHRLAKLAGCRRLLALPEPAQLVRAADYRERYQQLTGRSLDLCPICGGRMIEIGSIPRAAAAAPWNTS